MTRILRSLYRPILLLLGIPVLVLAAVPGSIAYQGRLTTSAGDPVADASYSVTFRIYSVSSGGTALWEETKDVATLNGLFSSNLGSVAPLDPSVFDGADRWLGITLNPESELTPRRLLLSTPFAMRSGEWSSSGSDISHIAGRVGVGAAASSSKMLISTYLNENALDVRSTSLSPSFPTLLATSNATAGRFVSIGQQSSPNPGVLQAEYMGGGAFDHIAVRGISATSLGLGIGGKFSGGFTGVNGEGDYYGVYGKGKLYGVAGIGEGPGFGSTSYGVYGTASGNAFNWAAHFAGNVNIVGNLTKSSGTFRIDHPLDPENKFLQHSFVESPDMKNIYDGVVTLDAQGRASVSLSDWFGALNADFRYQLTAIGAPAPNLYVAQKIANNQFSIAGGAPGMEVSWQVTGIRIDAYAQKNRIQVEVMKNPEERGFYLHPEAFGRSAELGIEYKRERAIREHLKSENSQK